MPLTLATFVKQLAVKLSEQDIPMPLRNQRPWHLLLYKLKKADAPGKPVFLADLWFDWDGPTPEAPDLSDFLARLHWNASVSAANPQYETLSVPEPIAQLWKAQTALSPDETLFLAAAVEEAKQTFGTAVPQTL